MKPQPKRLASVVRVSREEAVIRLDAAEEAWEDIKEFGASVLRHTEGNGGIVTVNGRHSFDEVLEYIKNWKPPSREARVEGESDAVPKE